MLRLICAGFCATLLYSSQTTLASTVFRCEDASGHITYTRNGCPLDASQALQSADNQTPGQGKPVPLAKTSKSQSSKSDKNNGMQVLVTGETQDGCGNRVTGSERRNAIIRQQVRSGMTQSDVESSLGKPDKVTTQDGQTRYQYTDTDGNRRQVTFDEGGCVKGKR
ncbi:outer membrane protein assembly factor BamE [Pseudomonas sp. J452]|uniref:outer membrane protein assembly factor BamE n=1 Tax=Pseudomonas sp. J452 TaxID=2898441 RepID=UPI0021AD9577|nr:outer membrane protein assembly factor BamE [Pseudomonas sp. J452]UUY06825.1 outer membrane protein assembly factor BamE [Pseudomonas sp. J452]